MISSFLPELSEITSRLNVLDFYQSDLVMYEMDGRQFDSLSALARAITGQKWNGRLFFGLTSRKSA